MQPVRIKYYGLISMTRRGYLISLAVGGMVAAGCLVFGAVMGHMPPLRSLWEPVVEKGPAFYVFFINNLYRFIILCLLLLALETYIILRKFASKEAEQQNQLGAALHQADAAEKPSEAIMEKKTGIVDKQAGQTGA
jgi:hypothetical protein